MSTPFGDDMDAIMGTGSGAAAAPGGTARARARSRSVRRVALKQRTPARPAALAVTASIKVSTSVGAGDASGGTARGDEGAAVGQPLRVGSVAVAAAVDRVVSGLQRCPSKSPSISTPFSQEPQRPQPCVVLNRGPTLHPAIVPAGTSSARKRHTVTFRAPSFSVVPPLQTRRTDDYDYYDAEADDGDGGDRDRRGGTATRGGGGTGAAGAGGGGGAAGGHRDVDGGRPSRSQGALRAAAPAMPAARGSRLPGRFVVPSTALVADIRDILAREVPFGTDPRREQSLWHSIRIAKGRKVSGAGVGAREAVSEEASVGVRECRIH